eukprot:1149294-Pelagomonas_calceolata.AAC.7
MDALRVSWPRRMSYLLPHLHSGWAVDQAILGEEDRVVVIRFGHDWDPQCMQMDEILASVADQIKNFAVIYLVDITKLGFLVKCVVGKQLGNPSKKQVTSRTEVTILLSNKPLHKGAQFSESIHVACQEKSSLAPAWIACTCLLVTKCHTGTDTSRQVVEFTSAPYGPSFASTVLARESPPNI